MTPFANGRCNGSSHDHGPLALPTLGEEAGPEGFAAEAPRADPTAPLAATAQRQIQQQASAIPEAELLAREPLLGPGLLARDLLTPGAEARRPTRDEAEAAVRTLIRWAGDDPAREGLLETPARVVRSYEEFFQGYRQDPEAVLAKTFEEIGGYHDLVLLRDIDLHSHCEHHMVPIEGKVHLAYLPEHRVVGISKLARVVEILARRLQIQEKLTVDIAETIQRTLQPRGVAVVVEAAHQCMTTRGVKKQDTITVTRWMTGEFRHDAELRREFLELIRG